MAAHTTTVLSICAGVGGLDIGVRIAIPGARTVCLIERESYAAATLVGRMEDAALEHAAIWDDLTTFDGRPWRGRIHLLTAGLPCQPYSIAGKQRGHEDERAIWPEFIRVVGEVQPWVVFIENVPEFLPFFRPVGDELSTLGYRIEEPLFVSASECGGTHERERLFILAHRNIGRWEQRADEAEPIKARGSGAREPEMRGSGVALSPRGGLGIMRQSPECDGRSGGGQRDSGRPRKPRMPSTHRTTPTTGGATVAIDASGGQVADARLQHGDIQQRGTGTESPTGGGRLWTTPQAHDEHKGRADRVGRYGTSAGGANLTDDAALWDETR